MRGFELNKIIEYLAKNFTPFNQLSKLRIPEIADALRVIEMYKGEIFQLRSDTNGDYLFLLKGHLDLLLPTGEVSLLSARNAKSRPFVLPPTTRPPLLKANDDVIVCHVNREMLDKLVSWDEVTQMYEGDGNEDIYLRLANLKNCLVLRSLPLEKAEMAFKRMREIKASKGDEIVRAGEQGQTFYIITSGKAEVWRRGLYDDELQYVETLAEGCSFGNGALITGQCSDRTVRMAEDGILLALDKPDFDEIIGKQLIKRINSGIAKSMLDNGYRLLDVRYEEEYEESYIPGATLIPLHDLAKRIGELDNNAKYIVYCHSGNRSAVAAMRLAQHNIEAWSMDGGIRDWPYAIEGPCAEKHDRRNGPRCRRKTDLSGDPISASA
ncbi:MAG: cyclic nucleotide-binding domain-containing protein [Gammaproteobacteria bacterium]|nr:cyclic nucleotide-binding domain-containing protein [Gammaproteobacteria bacterium]